MWRVEINTWALLDGVCVFMEGVWCGHKYLYTILYRNYLVVKYKDKPLEFWDLKTLTFLREMVSNPPSFSCIEWTPTTHRAKSKTDHTPSATAMPTVDFDMAMGADSKMAQVSCKWSE